MVSVTTVLVVDDEPIVREVVVSYLRRDGFTTLEAGDGHEARRLLEQRDPSLVVLDLMLPGMDGLEPLDPRTIPAARDHAHRAR
jgi:CheY-like chemotaxis protein